ncbi:MAG: UDP-3-O-(3-hydroxymyristoyl)glucosamine N-acyltransferase [Verrucomicrobia bacterium]|nr:UDP-3-O-(3-hydroxymyristoyl)glucosamine N-acyltransferase [Kiritimatiellia bacterium]MCB1102732.1 UDP-3-O-(3-hydroxymyristoyl)glucosamine N-acyltransferase [Kiritimatiellia bacterium]MCP5488765.1 UDP-3-O-(3-hydroxymyristoyl)glucosamine N-acyltransferase [Verrucomicrobiota bacterium]
MKLQALTAGDIADRLKGRCDGDPTVVLSGVGGVRDAQAHELAFVSQSRYASDASETRAGALLVGHDWSHPSPAVLIRVDKPEVAFGEIARWFAGPEIDYPPGIHPSAVISPEATVGEGVHIGPFCVVEAGASIGAGSILVGQVSIGRGARIGEHCRFYPQVSLREYVVIGDRVILHNGVVIGSDGFGYDVSPEGIRTKQPQIGIVIIGDDVEIGANSTVDRARYGKTRIGKRVKIDNLVQIAHNVWIQDDAVIVAQVGISGSTIVQKKAILAGQVGVAGHLIIGAGAIIGAQSGVSKDVAPGAYMFGTPAVPHKEFASDLANLRRLELLKNRVAALEARLGS